MSGSILKCHFKKSRFSVKELKGADGGHSLNRDFTVFVYCIDLKS